MHDPEHAAFVAEGRRLGGTRWRREVTLSDDDALRGGDKMTSAPKREWEPRGLGHAVNHDQRTAPRIPVPRRRPARKQIMDVALPFLNE
jgi:hypothetical protein